MKVTYYDYEPGGGRSLHVRENMYDIEISKSESGYGPYVFAQPGMMKDFGLPPVIICKAEDLYKIEEELECVYGSSPNNIKGRIVELPTAEPRKGRDVSGEVAYYCDFKCSLCGADIGIVEGGVMDGGEFNYCPNCGARMEESDE